MTRDLYIRTKSEIRRHRLGKNVRPLTVINRRLYRTDDALMIADRSADHQFVMYDIDGTQPYYAKKVLSPDLTMAYTDIAKQAGKQQAVSKIGFLDGLKPSWLIYGVLAVIIVYAVIAGGIV